MTLFVIFGLNFAIIMFITHSYSLWPKSSPGLLLWVEIKRRLSPYFIITQVQKQSVDRNRLLAYYYGLKLKGVLPLYFIIIQKQNVLVMYTSLSWKENPNEKKTWILNVYNSIILFPFATFNQDILKRVLSFSIFFKETILVNYSYIGYSRFSFEFSLKYCYYYVNIYNNAHFIK